jgi:CheY-like chemotaxis protein
MEKRALVVDDEPASCELIEKVLTSFGIETLTVRNSAEAPDILRHGRFLVAFLNYPMASLNSPGLIRQMRDSSYNRMTPVILLSADQRPRAMSEGFEAGATFFLYKPLDKECLMRLVRTAHGAMEVRLRRTRRVPLKSRVQLRFRGQTIEAETINMSMEGLLVKAPRAVPVGSSVDISLHLSKTMRPIVTAGSVVRMHGGDQMGIHLGRLNMVESQRLQEFLLPLIPGE